MRFSGNEIKCTKVSLDFSATVVMSFYVKKISGFSREASTTFKHVPSKYDIRRKVQDTAWHTYKNLCSVYVIFRQNILKPVSGTLKG